VRVRLDDARVVEVREPDGRGSPARPLPESAIVEKFRDNVGGLLTVSRRDELERAVLSIDGMPDVRKVMGLCRAVTGTA
jgi:hypothetical protein